MAARRGGEGLAALPKDRSRPLFRSQDGVGQSDSRKQNKVTAKGSLAPTLRSA